MVESSHPIGRDVPWRVASALAPAGRWDPDSLQQGQALIILFLNANAAPLKSNSNEPGSGTEAVDGVLVPTGPVLPFCPERRSTAKKTEGEPPEDSS